MENLKKLPAKLEIKANENRTILVEQVQNCEITINENATLTLITIFAKGWELPAKINFNLSGQNSTVTFLGINLGEGTEKFPIETNSIHTTQNTKAFYYLRSALFDQSEISYQGSLIIKKEAQLTETYLSHSTLMLSPKAKANTTPSLEIEADDVKAGHSATIGNVDDETLFYFESRGINKEEAKKIMIKGFLEQDLSKIEDSNSRKTIAEIIENLLNKHIK